MIYRCIASCLLTGRWTPWMVMYRHQHSTDNIEVILLVCNYAMGPAPISELDDWARSSTTIIHLVHYLYHIPLLALLFPSSYILDQLAYHYNFFNSINWQHKIHVGVIYTQTLSLEFFIYKQIKGVGKGKVPYSSLLNAFISTVSFCCDGWCCCCCSRIRSMPSIAYSLAILVASPNTVVRMRSKGPQRLRA